jgi:hypothetical protein
MPGLGIVLDPNLKPPSDLEAKLLRQIILAGMPDQVRKNIIYYYKYFYGINSFIIFNVLFTNLKKYLIVTCRDL